MHPEDDEVGIRIVDVDNRVKFSTPLSAPVKVSGLVILAVEGRIRTDPKDMLMKASIGVSSGALCEYAHSKGSRGRVLLAALLCAAIKTPEALASSTLLTAPPTLLPAVQP